MPPDDAGWGKCNKSLSNKSQVCENLRCLLQNLFSHQIRNPQIKRLSHQKEHSVQRLKKLRYFRVYYTLMCFQRVNAVN